MRVFNPTASHPARALQCWQILIGAAMNRQTLTYKLLSQKMYGKPAAGVLNEILGHIAYYCLDEELPPLTAIVVNSTGIPGHGIPIDQTNIDAQREQVFNHDWYDVYPPDEEQLARAFAATR